MGVVALGLREMFVVQSALLTYANNTVLPRKFRIT